MVIVIRKLCSFTQCRSLRLYKDYVEMYRAAVECLKKHRQENENFQQFIEVSFYDNYDNVRDTNFC